MKAALLVMAVLCGALVAATAVAQSPPPKTNPLKVYMHYMPWFESPATLGAGNWGYHWELKNRDPEIIDVDGRRQIASHYYPKLGPYASRDADVIECHLLLMKLSGVDGVLINWYGVQGSNGDVGQLLTNSNAIVDRVGEFGLEFGVMFEDRFARTIEDAKANVRYLRDNYFNRPEYIRHGAGDDPLMMAFGPITFQQPASWSQILAEAGEDVEFLTLWYESAEAGASGDGEFAWIYENEAADDHLNRQSSFLQTRTRQVDVASGVAYPGFNDFYAEGGEGEIIGFEIPHNGGQTLEQTLALAAQHADKIEMLQLATWNDFTEGTIFEPTVETGFAYLVQLQQFTGVPFGEADLELPFRLFRARKDHVGDANAQALLDEASHALSAFAVDDARAILDQLDPEGDFDDDGDVDASDFLVWQRQIGSVGLYPVNHFAADANVDGIVDGRDFARWQAGISKDAARTGAAPEPRGALMLTLAAVLCMLNFRR